MREKFVAATNEENYSTSYKQLIIFSRIFGVPSVILSPYARCFDYYLAYAAVCLWFLFKKVFLYLNLIYQFEMQYILIVCNEDV